MRMAIAALCFGFVAFFVGCSCEDGEWVSCSSVTAQYVESRRVGSGYECRCGESSWRVMSWGSCSDLRGDNAPRVDASWTVPDASVLDTREELDTGVSDAMSDVGATDANADASGSADDAP